MDLIVDGETFTVTNRAPGVYDFVWVSGPNAGYGFSSSHSNHEAQDRAELEASARDFLEMVDPQTGFIE
jgi:hypothetical protein